MDQKLKSVTAFTYLPSDDGLEESFKSSYIEYDKSGHIIENASYTGDGVIDSKTVSKYDDNGHKIEEMLFMTDEEVSEHTYIERNGKGIITKEKIKFFDGSHSIKTYDWNDASTEVTITTVDEDGEFEEKEFVKQDDKGNVLEHCYFDERAKLKEKIVNIFDVEYRLSNRKEFDISSQIKFEREYEYDEKGNVLKQVIYNRKHELVDYLKFLYDEHGRVIEQKVGNHYTLVYEYDDVEHTQIEKRFLVNGLQDHENISRFNENQLLLEEENMNGITKYEYEYFA